MCATQQDLFAGIAWNSDLNNWTQTDEEFEFQASGHHYVNQAIQLVRQGIIYVGEAQEKL